MESQNLNLRRKYDASKFGGYCSDPYKKYKILSIFSKYLSLSVQTCLKVRFYQVLHVSVIFISRNVEILKSWAKNSQKAHFSQKLVFLKIRQVQISGTEMMLGS